MFYKKLKEELITRVREVSEVLINQRREFDKKNLEIDHLASQVVYLKNEHNKVQKIVSYLYEKTNKEV